MHWLLPRWRSAASNWASRSPARTAARCTARPLSTCRRRANERASRRAGGSAGGWLEHGLRLGVTEGSIEFGEVLWLECNAAELNGVSFSKGCFVGQENTARMNWRQKVNRRLVVVETGTSGPRTRVHYPELGLAVEHRRTDDLAGAIIPQWLEAALAQPSTA